MLQQHSILRALFRKYWIPTLTAAALLMAGNVAAWADDPTVGLIETIPVPVSPNNTTAGGLYSYDISWVDQGTQKYFLADRSNKRVDILDAANPGTVTQISATPPFAGFTACVPVDGHGANDCAGPDGVATRGQCLFVTDAPSRVVSFTNSPPYTQRSDVKTDPTEPTRADELAVGPAADGNLLLLVINNAATPPFGTWIKADPVTCAMTGRSDLGVKERITLDAAHGVDAQNGAEQPAWQPYTNSFYLSIPQIGATVSHGGVIRLDRRATSVNPSDTIPIEHCSPAGLTAGPGGDMFVGCNTVFDTAGNLWATNGGVTAAPQDVIIHAQTKTVVASVPGVGAGDEVWFNAGDNVYYATGSTSPFRPLDTAGGADAKGATPLGVVDASSAAVLQLVTTYNVPANGTIHPAGTAHSVAANAANNLVFVPLGANNSFPNCLNGCIAIFGH